MRPSAALAGRGRGWLEVEVDEEVHRAVHRGDGRRQQQQRPVRGAAHVAPEDGIRHARRGGSGRDVIARSHARARARACAHAHAARTRTRTRSLRLQPAARQAEKAPRTEGCEGGENVHTDERQRGGLRRRGRGRRRRRREREGREQAEAGALQEGRRQHERRRDRRRT
eukprot:6068314-Prymnesium_polylepis.1